jgi:bifunctional enzyme CysN/CysC
MVVRPDSTFRGYAGTVMSGMLRRGDTVRALPSGVHSRIDRIVTFDGDLDEAAPGTPVTIVLSEDIDLARGDLLVHADTPVTLQPLRSHRIDATLIWLDHAPHASERRLLLRAHTGVSGVRIARVTHALDIATLQPHAAAGVALNDVVRVVLDVEREHVFDSFGNISATGVFVLIDRATQAVVAAGLAHGIPSPFDRDVKGELEARPSRIAPPSREARLGHAPVTVLITGMSGSGKTTLALTLEERLFTLGATAVRLDGEALRLGLSRGLGFGAEDREEHLRRAAETARLMNDHGQIVIIAAQAPAQEARERMTDIIGHDRAIEIHLHAPDELRRARDPSGAHAAVARGDIDPEDLRGIAVCYEAPLDPDLAFDTSIADLDTCADAVVALLRQRGVLPDQPAIRP